MRLLKAVSRARSEDGSAVVYLRLPWLYMSLLTLLVQRHALLLYFFATGKCRRDYISVMRYTAAGLRKKNLMILMQNVARQGDNFSNRMIPWGGGGAISLFSIC